MKLRKRLCVYCDRPFLQHEPLRARTVEHVLPKAAGGTEAPDNTAAACLGCNRDKADRTLADWYPKLCTDGDFRAVIVQRFMRRLVETNGYERAQYLVTGGEPVALAARSGPRTDVKITGSTPTRGGAPK